MKEAYRITAKDHFESGLQFYHRINHFYWSHSDTIKIDSVIMFSISALVFDKFRLISDLFMDIEVVSF
jgi:hypothetical protein